MNYTDLILQFGALAGAAALIAALVNALKAFGLVKDGDAPTWSAGLNLLGLAALLALKVFRPDLDVGALDAQVAQIAQALIVVLGFVVQLGLARQAHAWLRGVKVIGKSHTRDGSGESQRPQG